MNIKYPFTISNKDLYCKTNEIEWSKVIKKRRLRWLGHLLRLPPHAPARLAFNESKTFTKANKRTCKLTWNKVINKDLKGIDSGYFIEREDIEQLAEDRVWWASEVVGKAWLCPQQGRAPYR